MVKSHNEMMERLNALGDLVGQLDTLADDEIPTEEVLVDRTRHLEGLVLALHDEFMSYKAFCATKSVESRIVHRIGQLDKKLCDISERFHHVWNAFMTQEREIHMEKVHGIKRKERYVN
jgi:hypothetical protein